MTGRIVIATILGLCASMTAGAQTFTQRLQTARQGGATVTVHQDKSIDDLVNGAHLGTTVTPSRVQPVEKSQAVVAPSAKKPSAQNPTEKKPSAQTSKEKKDATHQQPSKDTASHHSSSSADTTAVHPKSGRTYKVMGYRVQAFAGGNSRKDKQKAEQTGNQLRMLDLPYGQLPHLRGGIAATSRGEAPGLYGGNHREGKNHRTVLISNY